MKTYRATRVFNDGVNYVELRSGKNIKDVLYTLTVYENCISNKCWERALADLVSVLVEEITQ